MYVSGGETSSSVLSECWIFHFDTELWELFITSGEFTARHSHASVAVGRVLYVFGGINGISGAPMTGLQSVDVTTGVWTDIVSTSSEPSARYSTTLWVMDSGGTSDIYLYGGVSVAFYFSLFTFHVSVDTFARSSNVACFMTKIDREIKTMATITEPFTIINIFTSVQTIRWEGRRKYPLGILIF